MAAADFLMAVFLISVSLLGACFSLQMPSPRGWYTSPALFPMFVFSGLTVMAVILLIGSMKTKLKYIVESIRGTDFSHLLRSENPKRFWFLISTVFIYIYILLNFLFFELATVFFLTATLFAFSKLKLLKILFISMIFTTTTSLSLTMFMKTLLPGESLLWLLLRTLF